jgi:TolB-like protein/tetratricopeptide (TPR) repeat protein
MSREEIRSPQSTRVSPPAAAPGAVFLSYGSEDAVAAERVATALRAAGIEVWFDKNELRGGDAWDRQIRDRIHECRLFIPVISANTERRDEGYFRREWSLAVDRTRDMAEKKTFLIPVVIDDTLQRGASVPEKFRHVQWSSLPGGDTPQAFIARIAGLLTAEAPAATPAGPNPNPTEPTGTAAPTALPDRPSIVVMPFVNLSGDPAQDYFSDGITEDIITELSRWRLLAVRSRSASFRYRRVAVDIKQIARELNVRFVVEGSVRRMAERIRINVQVVDAETGSDIWVEKFDRALEEVFAVQDRVVQTIVSTLVGRVQISAAERARRKPPTSLAAYECVLKGNALSWDDPRGAAEAVRLFEKAIELDPNYAYAHALLAVMLSRRWHDDLHSSNTLLEEAYNLARRGVELDDGESTCYAILGQVCQLQQHYDLAVQYGQRAVELNPNNQWNAADLAGFLVYAGEPEEALRWFSKAREIDPYFDVPWYWRGAGLACMVLRRYVDALSMFGHARGRLYRNAALTAGCHARLGDLDRTRASAALCLSMRPDFSIAQFMLREPFKNPADAEQIAASLRLAGLPD